MSGWIQATMQQNTNSLPTNDPTNNRINWIWMSKKIGLKYLSFNICYWGKLKTSDFGHFKLANKTIVMF